MLQTAPKLPKVAGISHRNLGPWDANSNKWASGNCGQRPTACNGKENRPGCGAVLVAPRHPTPSVHMLGRRQGQEWRWVKDGAWWGGRDSPSQSLPLGLGALQGPPPSGTGGTSMLDGPPVWVLVSSNPAPPSEQPLGEARSPRV